MREYIVNEGSERTRVILDLTEYERLLEAAEELEDIAAYDEAKAAIEKGEDRPMPLGEALPRIERERGVEEKGSCMRFYSPTGRRSDCPGSPLANMSAFYRR